MKRIKCYLAGAILLFVISLGFHSVSVYAADLKLSEDSAALLMTGTSSVQIMVTISDVEETGWFLSYAMSNEIVSCNWGTSWYTDADGNSSIPITITGKYGGTTTVTFAVKKSTTGEVLVSKTVDITVGPNYTVSYDANGGSGGPSSQTKYYGKALELSFIKPTRTGYTFQGWSTSSTATSATYSEEGECYLANSDVTMYAVWKAETYTITFNTNEGEGALASQIKTYGVNLTLSSTEPTRTGYTFLGWSTSSTAISASYSAGSSYTLNSSATLYAVWAVNTYIVSYNANGGSGAPASQTKTYGVTLTLSSTKPTRTGYTFLGWSTNSAANSVNYTAGQVYSGNDDLLLYAVWNSNPSETTDGGTTNG
ncbi:MAG: InlB B-repeat-containing protein, partial [Lachnospiraceae bacterium]|nr:InlB B-repeat-containing protein [Lachnospiraceae bacterium]